MVKGFREYRTIERNKIGTDIIPHNSVNGVLFATIFIRIHITNEHWAITIKIL